MGSIVPILKGPAGERVLEGWAEMIETLEYKGDGWYRVKCIFVDDPKQDVCERDYKIDEPCNEIKIARARETTPPPREGV